MKESFIKHLNLFNSNFNCKKYNNEYAIISLTSWKKRIRVVEKTIQNLLEVCKNCHIVLVLSSDEFTHKEKELPLSLLKLTNKIEILWIKENIKALKKVMPTIEKYKELNIPIFSADDDCYYTCDYVKILYDKFKEIGENKFIRYSVLNTIPQNETFLQGQSQLYPPKYYDLLLKEYYRILKLPLKEKKYIIDTYGDDYMSFVVHKNNIEIISLYYYNIEKPIHCFKFHSHDIAPIHPQMRTNKSYADCFKEN